MLRSYFGRVDKVDKAVRVVEFEGRRVTYDTLIIATGARHGYFGRDDWEGVAPGLKKIDDATKLRHQILQAFEEAETTDNAEERRRLLNFVIIGGGPTGVELAGALAELAKVALARDFRRVDPRSSRIVLVESGRRVSRAFRSRCQSLRRTPWRSSASRSGWATPRLRVTRTASWSTDNGSRRAP